MYIQKNPRKGIFDFCPRFSFIRGVGGPKSPRIPQNGQKSRFFGRKSPLYRSKNFLTKNQKIKDGRKKIPKNFRFLLFSKKNSPGVSLPFLGLKTAQKWAVMGLKPRFLVVNPLYTAQFFFPRKTVFFKCSEKTSENFLFFGFY